VRLTPADSAGVFLTAEASGEGGWLLWVRSGTLVAQRLALTGEPVKVAGGARGVMHIARPAEHRAVLFEQRVQHPEARAHHQLEEFGSRVDQEFHKRERTNGGGRFNITGPTGCTRFLHGGSFTGRRVASGLVTTRLPRAVTEPRFNFNNPWDIPGP
jgi:hypothetical protein